MYRRVRIAPPQDLFCDGNPGDCKDGSDETACTVDEDPNAAPKCDLSQCILPDCFCSADGTKIPGKSARIGTLEATSHAVMPALYGMNVVVADLGWDLDAPFS